MLVKNKGTRVVISTLMVAFAGVAFMGLQTGIASAAAPPNVAIPIFPTEVTGNGCADNSGFEGLYQGVFCIDTHTLSDAPDGFDSAAHLSVESDDLGTQATAYACKDTFDPFTGGTNCIVIGTDTTATPAPGTNHGAADGPNDAGNVFDVFYKIPATLDQQIRDVWWVVCNGSPAPGSPNCTNSTPQDASASTINASPIVNNVTFDSVSTGAGGATSTGEITSPTNGAGINECGFSPPASCNAGGDVFTATTDPLLEAINLNLEDDVNGANCPFDCGSYYGDDADENNDGCTLDQSPDSTSATARTWSVDDSGANSCGDTPDDDSDSFLTLTDNDDGSMNSGVNALCDTGSDGYGCALDRHYNTTLSIVRGVSHVHLKTAADVAKDATCHTGAQTAQVPAGGSLDLVSCLQDTLHHGVAGKRDVFVIGSGPGAVASSENVSDANGQAKATLSAPESASGQSTTVFDCYDANNNGGCDISAGLPTETFASFQVNWGPPVAPPAGASTLTLAQTGRHKNPGPRTPGGTTHFTGNLVGSDACAGKTGNQLVQIHKGSATGPVVISATTAAGGNYTTGAVNIPWRHKTRKAYVATYGAAANANSSCLDAVSNTINVRGFAKK
ncbi:MAG: hypothetical protein ABR600_10115 [Actinomycetota bacterium]